jgi:hypothetical protein
MTAAVSLALALFTAAAPPEPDAGTDLPRISAEVSEPKVKLGEPFTYTVTVTHPSNERWELRSPGDLGPFGLRGSDRQRVDRRSESGTTFRLELQLFELGAHTIPVLVFDVVGGGTPHTASVAGPIVEGLSSLPPDAAQTGAKLMDIKPNEDVPVRSWRLLWVLLALAALVAGGLWLRRWLDARRGVVPLLPPLPLPERTRAALEALRAEGLLAKGLVREYHFRLSEIVRGYLGERFAFEAMECTSWELLNAVERLGPPGVDQPGLQRFVDQSDVAKFARAEISPAACQWAMDYALRLVDATTPPPPAVTPDAA